MFSPTSWSRNPFFNHIPSPYAHSAAPATDLKSRHPRRHPRRHAPGRPSLSHNRIEGSEFSSNETVTNDYDPYYLSDNNESRLHDSYRGASHYKRRTHDDAKPALRCAQLAIQIPQRSASTLNLRANDLLILAPTATLTRVKIYIRSAASNEKLRAAVAVDLRLRDVVKQVLPAGNEGEVRVQIKFDGEWQEVSRSVTLRDVVESGMIVRDEGRDVEVEVKIVVGGGGRGGMRIGMGFGGAKGWEREEMMGMWGEKVWIH